MGVSGVDGPEIASSAPARGTLASFVVKRRPVGCGGDCEWRSVNARGSATVDRGVELCDSVFEEPYFDLAKRVDVRRPDEFFQIRRSRRNLLALSRICKERAFC